MTVLKCVLIDPLLPSPAPEILDYLARYPDAEDTIDGILHWWVLDACLQKWAPKIAKTVEQLVEQGFLEQKICGWQRILPHLPAISRDASATATTKLYS